MIRVLRLVCRNRAIFVVLGCLSYVVLFGFTEFYINKRQTITINFPLKDESSISKHPGEKLVPSRTGGYFADLPSITLTIRTTGHLKSLMYCIALRTIVLYWSQHIGDIGIILDKEKQTDYDWAANLLKHQDSMGIHFKFYYEPLPKDPSIFVKVERRSPGYNRQIYSSFLIDQFIETDVVAWTDTDGKFTVPISSENIINDGKLRTKGMSTFEYTSGWSELTERMIGHGMISDFMTYFPVYIWRDTITNCRKHILKHMNVTDVEEAFLKTGPGNDLSPVNVIMTFAYYYENHRYDWHIDIKGHDLDGYNKKHASPGFELTPAYLTPEIHVSVHHKYYIEKGYALNRKAYCFAIRESEKKPTDAIKAMCQAFQDDTMWELFKFVDWGPRVQQEHVTTWCKDDRNLCLKLINDQYARVKGLIKQGVYDLDLEKVKAVEHAAQDMGVTCGTYF